MRYNSEGCVSCRKSRSEPFAKNSRTINTFHRSNAGAAVADTAPPALPLPPVAALPTADGSTLLWLCTAANPTSKVGKI